MKTNKDTRSMIQILKENMHSFLCIDSCRKCPFCYIENNHLRCYNILLNENSKIEGLVKLEDIRLQTIKELIKKFPLSILEEEEK